MMRVTWVQDLEIWSHMGGAERTDQEMVKQGFRRGHEIELITPQRFPPIETINCDVVVFSNVHVLIYADQGKRLLKLAEKHPHVMWHHDFFCRWRLYYPMKEKCKNCVYLHPWRKLYSESILNIWMSPLHRKGFLFAMPELADHPYALVPSAINPADYQLKEELNPKPRTVIGVNCLFGFKGKDNIIKYAEEHPELSFTFAGGSEGNILLPRNCKYIGPKSRMDLVKLYAESEYLIHLPSSPSPFDRVPAEFLIANPKGKLITNRLVGALSYPDIVRKGKINREKLIQLVSTSPQRFWEKVEAVYD